MRSIFLRGISMALFLSLAFPFLASAQLTEDKVLEEVYRTRKQSSVTGKSWTEGPLSWNDFRRAEPWEEETSNIYIDWNEGRAKMKKGITTYSYPDFHAFFNTTYSYVKEDAVNQLELKLNQGIFNINEKYARMWGDILAVSDADKKELKNTLTRECEAEVAAWRESLSADPESALPVVPGENTVALPEAFPFRESYLGLGYSQCMFLNTINGYRPWAGAVALTFGMRFNRFFMELEGDVSSFGGNHILPGRFYTDYFCFNLKGGYTLINTGRFRTGVFAGGGYCYCHFMDYRKYNLTSSPIEYFCATEGVIAEYDIARWVSLKGLRTDYTRASVFFQLRTEQDFLGSYYSLAEDAQNGSSAFNVYTLSASAGLRIYTKMIK